MLKDVVQLGRTGGLPAIQRALHRRLRPSTWTQYGLTPIVGKSALKCSISIVPTWKGRAFLRFSPRIRP